MNFPTQPSETKENGIVYGNDVTSDIAIRRAINIGIDRAAIIENVT